MEVLTPNDGSYSETVPCQSQSIRFSIKAQSSAWIGVSSTAYGGPVEPTIAIGGYSNTKTILVIDSKIKSELSNIRLDRGKFLDFWFRWDNGRVRFGVGTDTKPLIDKSITELIGWERAEALKKTRFVRLGVTGETPGTWIIRDDALNGLNPQWKKPTAGGMPDEALMAGFEDDSPLYIGRRKRRGLLVEEVHPTLTDLNVSKGDFRILCGIKNPLWQTVDEASVLSRALVAGFTYEGDPVYIGRARHKMDIRVGCVEGTRGLQITDGNDIVNLTPYQVLVVPEKK